MIARKARSRVLVTSDVRGGGAYVAFVRRTLTLQLRVLNLESVEVSACLVDDDAIRALNRAWRRKDKATDVLSFPAGEPLPGVPAPHPLGDIVVSLHTTQRRAREEGRPIRSELARYLAHGLLHLLGHDHHTPAESRTMARWERKLLGQAGMLQSR